MTQTIESPTTQPLAKRPAAYAPLSPIGSAGGLKGLLEAQSDSIARVMPRHVTPERLIKTLLVAANRNPDILKCTQASVLETINRAAELGLDLSGTLGEAYPVPFNNKIKTREGGDQWVMQLQLIIGYRGMEKLAWQTGEVESIDAEVVCKNDHFVFRKGTEVHIEWSPCLDGPRGDAIGAYACVKMKAGGKLARFLTRDDIEKIRSSAKSKDSPAWRNWWSEMARKCALKRTLKDAPLSTEKYVRVMEHDDADYGLSDVVEAETRPQRGSKGVLQRLTQRPVSEGQTFEADPAAAEAAHVEQQRDEQAAVNIQTGEVTEADVSGADAEPFQREDPAELAAVLTVQWEDFEPLVRAKMKEAGAKKPDIDGGIFKWGQAHPDKSEEERRELYFAVVEKRFDYSKGVIVSA